MRSSDGATRDLVTSQNGAGWDYGLHAMDGYREIFDGLIENARASGAEAIARVAEVHRQFL